MKTKTNIKAGPTRGGGYVNNHNQSLSVKSNVKAGMRKAGGDPNISGK